MNKYFLVVSLIVVLFAIYKTEANGLPFSDNEDELKLVISNQDSSDYFEKPEDSKKVNVVYVPNGFRTFYNLPNGHALVVFERSFSVIDPNSGNEIRSFTADHGEFIGESVLLPSWNCSIFYLIL